MVFESLKVHIKAELQALNFGRREPPKLTKNTNQKDFGIMRDLNYSLKQLCHAERQGSYATKAARFSALQLCADQLYDLGFKLPAAKSIKPKHVRALVDNWKAGGLSIGTIKNRLSHIRFWADKVDRKSILESNEAYGIGQRESFKGNKAQRLDLGKLATIESERVKMSLRLQAAFGLRREESIKFRPGIADQGDKIALQCSWTKGGKAREIPITTDKQRELLEEAKALVGDSSLIPEGMSYYEHVQVYKHSIAKAKLGRLHGLRHNYAQWRYKQLSGMDAPAVSGVKYADLSDHEKLMDTLAREIVSRELGHSRLDVTNVYLGGRK